MTIVTALPIWPGILLASLSLTLGGCQDGAPAPGQPAHRAAVMNIFVDGSSSTAFINSPGYSDGAIKRVGQAVMAQHLGDAFRIIPFGSRTTDRAVDVFSATSGYSHRLPVVRKQIEAGLGDLFAKNRASGGDGSTNLLYALENSGPVCAPGSKIEILSDGIEESESYSVGRALSAGRPVELPPPSTPYLKGCSIEFIGIGISPMGSSQTAETLPSDKLKALIAGWRTYFQAAGVNSGDMSFTSIL